MEVLDHARLRLVQLSDYRHRMFLQTLHVTVCIATDGEDNAFVTHYALDEGVAMRQKDLEKG